MANIVNAAGSGEDGRTAAQIKSEGQKLLDRQLAARNRLRLVVSRLGDVKTSIAGPSIDNSSDGSTDTATSFFEGLSLMTNEFERVAGELEASVEEIGRLF